MYKEIFKRSLEGDNNSLMHKIREVSNAHPETSNWEMGTVNVSASGSSAWVVEIPLTKYDSPESVKRVDFKITEANNASAVANRLKEEMMSLGYDIDPNDIVTTTLPNSNVLVQIPYTVQLKKDHGMNR